jgi:hypothetical protein
MSAGACVMKRRLDMGLSSVNGKIYVRCHHEPDEQKCLTQHAIV